METMTGGVHIVAVGARTPLGMTAESSAAAVQAGITRVAEHPFLIDRKAEPIRMACDPRLDPGVLGVGRMTEMVTSCLEEIGHKLMARCSLPEQVPLFLCLPEPRPGFALEQVKKIGRELLRRSLPVPFNPVETYPLGHAAGLFALDGAITAIRSGQIELCTIAGVDSYLHLETLRWLDSNRQLVTSYHRGGFFPGEGAGAFVLACESFVQRVGLNSLAEVRGTGTAVELKRIKTDAVCLGEELTEAIRQATLSLGPPHVAIDGILCDINGERYRSEEWGFSLLRLSEILRNPTGYELPTSCWGDVGAASGPLLVTLAVAAGQRGYAQGSHYLVWNSSEGGQRAAAVLEVNHQGQGVML